MTSLRPEFIPIGYFAKKVVPKPEWLATAGVEEICSVSTCFSAGPPDAMDHWTHNGLLLYDSESALCDIVASEGDPGLYTFFAYRLLPVAFAHDGEHPIGPADLPARAGSGPSPEPLPAGYERLGHDCVQTEWEKTVAGFGCSPLSCNRMAEQIPVNRFCLIDRIDDAIDAARQFGLKQPEPGVYYVVEVWRKPRDDSGS